MATGSAGSAMTEKQTRDSVEEFFKVYVVQLEKVFAAIDRAPIFALLFFDRSSVYAKYAAKMLISHNFVLAVLFIGRLLNYPSAIQFNLIYYIDQIAFIFVALFCYFGYLTGWKIAAGLYTISTMLLIKCIIDNKSNLLKDWSNFKTKVSEMFFSILYDGEYYDGDYLYDDDEPEPPKEEVHEQNQVKEEAEAAADGSGEVSEGLRKTEEIDDECEEDEQPEFTEDDDDDLELTLASREEEEPKTKVIREPGGLCDDIVKAPKELIDLLNEFKQRCHKLKEEKNELTRKLHATTKSLESCRENELNYAEDRIKLERLVSNLDRSSQSSEQYRHIVNDDGLEVDFEWEKGNRYNDYAVRLANVAKAFRAANDPNVFNASNAANAFSVAKAAEAAKAFSAALNGQAHDDFLEEDGAAGHAGDPGVFPSPHDYQMMYQDDVDQWNAKLLKREEEKNDLLAKLSAANAWYQYYALATYDYQLQNHNLLVERNDLFAKLQTASTSAEFYKACFDDSDNECRKLREENHNLSAKLLAKTSSSERYHKLVGDAEKKCQKLEEEKNELVAKVCTAKAACELYRSYLHDVSP